MDKLPISCFIIAKNEADRIARTIRSVRPWVDEIVVVDSESTDDTVRVAALEGCRVITQRWLGFGGQKRFAEDQCRNDWVLNLDADEVVTSALRREIISLFAHVAPRFVAYGMPIELVYPNTSRPRRWARDHWYVRLYDRRIVRFRDSIVHDLVVTDGHAVGILRAPAYHYSFRSYDDLKRKLAERMQLSAKHATSTPPKLLARMAIEFPVNFFKYYIGRRHFMGGRNGLRYSWVQADYRLLKIFHMWRDRSSKSRAEAHSIADGQESIEGQADPNAAGVSSAAEMPLYG